MIMVLFISDIDDLIEQWHPESNLIVELKDGIEGLTKENNKLKNELKVQIDKNEAIQKEPPKNWRAAFKYESVGLNALYDLIEENYFDEAGIPIYDIKQLPKKKWLKSGWLVTEKSRRTLEEVDTIITSRKRRGINDK